MSQAESTRAEAAQLREQAERYRRAAAHLEQAAEALAGCSDDAARLGGRKLIDAAITVLRPGETAHYLTILERLRDADYEPGGKRPENTLLAALNRSPYFSQRGHRSGEYVYHEPGGSYATE